MSKVMTFVLPRVRRSLYKALNRLKAGQLEEAQFLAEVEAMLSRRRDTLVKRGLSLARAAIAIHAAVLVCSRPGMQVEAEESCVPLEVIENRTLREAAADVAMLHALPVQRVANALARLVAKCPDFLR